MRKKNKLIIKKRCKGTKKIRNTREGINVLKHIYNYFFLLKKVRKHL